MEAVLQKILFTDDWANGTDSCSRKFNSIYGVLHNFILACTAVSGNTVLKCGGC